MKSLLDPGEDASERSMMRTADSNQRVLQWFTGNIGFHHIHHLSLRIPNYNLERCHDAQPLFQTVPPVTLFGSFKSFAFRLWDEQRQRLVGFGHLQNLRQTAQHPKHSLKS